jgi:hypothetical protein
LVLAVFVLAIMLNLAGRIYNIAEYRKINNLSGLCLCNTNKRGAPDTVGSVTAILCRFSTYRSGWYMPFFSVEPRPAKITPRARQDRQKPASRPRSLARPHKTRSSRQSAVGSRVSILSNLSGYTLSILHNSKFNPMGLL